MSIPGSAGRRRSKAGERGGPLLAELWNSAALTAIAFSVSATVRTETERAGNSTDGLRAAYLASGSVERAIQWICWGPQYRQPDGKPLFYEWKMPRLAMSFPTGDAVVEMIPESAKMNINQAPAEDIARVIAAISGDAGQAQQIAAAIVDWRGGGWARSTRFMRPSIRLFRLAIRLFRRSRNCWTCRASHPSFFTATTLRTRRAGCTQAAAFATAFRCGAVWVRLM